MAQNYTRQSSFADGDTVTAALFNNEYNQLVNAFAYSSSSASSTGHRHDGNTGQGGNVPQIGDLDFLNKVVVDGTNNRVGFFVEVSSSAVEQIRVQDGAIVPVTDNDIDLGTSSLEFKDGYFDGTLHADAINFNGTAITATAAELNIMDGVTSTAAELNILDGVTATASELNYSDTGSSTGTVVADKVVTVDSNKDVSSFRNITLTGELDAGSLDISGDADIDGTLETDALSINGTAVTSTAAELNILDGVTATAAELNYSDTGQSVGTVVAGKVVTVDSNKDVASFRNITLTGELDAGSLDISGDADIDGTLETDALSINGTTVTSTAAELNILDGVTSTAAELNILDGVTATASEINTLDGITAVVGELNALDLGSTAVGTAIASKAVILDANKDYTGIRNLTITGELDAATLDISGDVDVDGTLETDALSINGTTVTATAAELNILDGVTVTAAEINTLDGITAVLSELNALDLGSTAIGTAVASKAVILDSNKDYTGIRNFTITGELDAATLDISGDADIDGTTNLDVVDIDGAVDMASTLTLAGNADFNGDLDVDGTTNLDVVDIDGAVDMASTLNVTGAITGTSATFTVDGNDAALTVSSTDADASLGPLIVFKRESSSPADDDLLGRMNFNGLNDASAGKTYGRIQTTIRDASDGTEDGELTLSTIVAGSNRSRAKFGATETVFNEGSVDLDFRVETDTDENALFIQGSTNRVMLGFDANVAVANINPHLSVVGTDNGGSAIGLVRYSADTSGPRFVLGKSRNGSIATAGGAVVQDGDTVGMIQFSGDDGSDIASRTARIQSQVSGTPGSDDMPGLLQFMTTADGAASESEHMRITSDGNVAIGTTTASTLLTVAGDITATSSGPSIFLTDTDHNPDYQIKNGNGTLRIIDATNSHDRINCSSTETIINESSADLDFRIETDGAANKFFVDGGNNVVVMNNNAPVSSVSVNSTFQIQGNSNANSGMSINRYTSNNSGPYLNFSKSRSTSVGDNFTIVQDGDTLGRVSFVAADGVDFAHQAAKIIGALDGTPGANDVPGRLEFHTTADGSNSTSEAMRIDNLGQVQIGTATPVTNFSDTAHFVVQENLDAVCAKFICHQSTVTSVDNPIIEVSFQDDTALGNGSRFMIFTDEDSTVGTIQSASSTSLAFGTGSDERLKENIVDAPSQLDKILDLDVRQFDWKKSGETEIGFVAQEVKKVLPNCAGEGGDDPSKNPWTIYKAEFVPYLVSAIQEQQKQIEELKSEIKKLKGGS